MTVPRRYPLIVFDWDGTLFDSTAHIVAALQGACADVGADVPSRAAAAQVIGLGLSEALRAVAPALRPTDLPALADRYRHHYRAAQDGLNLFEGTVPLLQALRGRGHRLAIATGKSRRGLDEVLARPCDPLQPGSLPLGALFEATRTADETHSKPHPRMLQELMEACEAEPAATLMVGDTLHDLQLAANAGTDALAVAYGAHPAGQLATAGPRAVLGSPAELAAWLAAHG